MKKNYWLVLGTLVATSAMAQVNTNSLPGIPAPAPAPAAAAPDSVAPADTAAPAVPAPKAETVHEKQHRVVKKLHEPTVNLVPGPAVVMASILNVRGHAGLHGEIIGHLRRGATVNVISQVNLSKHALDEPAQWAKIALPTGIKVWVSSHYVDFKTKTVTATKLNLRSGPGENYSVIGRIDRGTHVTQIASKRGWIEIQPPADAFAFVAAMYLNQNVLASQTPAPAPETTSETTSASTPELAQTAPATPPVTAPSAPVPPAESQPPTTPEPATQPTPAPVPPPQAIPAPTPSMASTPAPAPVIPAPETTSVNTNPPPPRVATHQGYVRPSLSVIAPTSYELYDPISGKTINYLYSPTTNLDLSRYNGTEIIVTGQEGLAARWKSTPVMTVQRIYVVSTKPPKPYKRLQSPRASQQNIRGTQPEKKRAKHH